MPFKNLFCSFGLPALFNTGFWLYSILILFTLLILVSVKGI